MTSKGYIRLGDLKGETGLFSDGDWIETKDQSPLGEIRLIQLADIGDGQFLDKSNRHVTSSTAARLNCTLLEKNDVLIARMPDPLGRACVFSLPHVNSYITVVDVAVLRVDHSLATPRYVCAMINAPQTRKSIELMQSGTTRSRISRKNLATIQIPRPPLPEQERIVSRIEELFSDLDKGVEALQTIKAQLKVYRQAVLKEAFEDVVEFVELNALSTRIFDGPFGTNLMTSDYVSSGVRVVRLENIKYLKFDNEKKSFVTPDKYESIKQHTVFSTDLIMSTFITDCIRVCQMPVSISFAINKADCVGIRLKPEINPKYVMYFLSSHDAYVSLCNQIHGATRPRVNSKQIRGILIPKIPLLEQNHIVTEIESRLSVCDKIEQTVDESLAKAESLRQSILKKAFEGRL